MRGGVILCIASAGLTTVAIATGPALSGASEVLFVKGVVCKGGFRQSQKGGGIFCTCYTKTLFTESK